MKRLFKLSAALSCAILIGCDGSSQTQGLDNKGINMVVEPGVSASLAKDRAQRIAELSYDLSFSVPSDPALPLNGRIVISFDLSSIENPLQIDFAQSADSITTVTAEGKLIAHSFENEHILIPSSALRMGRNQLTLDFLAPQDAVNRNPDYLFTLFVPDRARRAFPLFDQPDLKARYRLTLETPADWTALGNGSRQSIATKNGRQVFRFANTDPLPSYLFSFVAGKFETVTRSMGGRDITMLHRETDTEKLDRNIDAIFEIHSDSLEWLEDYTAIDYPFEKFAFALIPDFPYGGMEHVGAIQYRASSLLLEDAPSESQLLNRAQLIAHETAHMWFGNLVTMRWFDDVWTKEVFANFMADKIVNPQFPETDHELNFLVSHYPQAYGVDRTEGANPIRQRLDNLNLAGQMYGPIIYHKAPIMMRQLELLLGEKAFQEGLQTYLSRYSYANATWPALIDILDAKTQIDLASWSEVWVNSAGMPVFSLSISSGGAGDTGKTVLRQIDPTGAGREWSQQFSLLSLSDATETSMLAAAEATLPEKGDGESLQNLLFNADGLGYGRFPVDTALLNAWDSLTPLQRGVLLVSGFEELLSDSEESAAAYFDTLTRIVLAESNDLLIELAAKQLHYVYFSLLNTQERSERIPRTESDLWLTMQAQETPSKTKMFFELFTDIALSTEALEHVHNVWSGKEAIPSLHLQEAERIRLAEIIAVRLPDRAEEVISKQRQETTNPDRLRRLDFLAPALSNDPEIRNSFFESLKTPENRATEVWVSDALRRLHDPTRLDHSAAYVLPSLELLEEIQVTGDIFFPSAWLNRSLGPHSAPKLASTVREFLENRPDYNPQLRMKILQAADPLFRASQRRTKAL
ncbi:M1 family aminopeptidase [Congregibacter brevis]|uniref:Aminopeptidase N n=1 Tax=Congregibacter brevis TaxID=3081201 RepID=A0ABZ0IGC0_9GAMM|nr:M1 family aminopeptidase [Congregibacter sp. IMCC45268]